MSVRRSRDGSRRKGAAALLAVAVAIVALAGPATAQAAKQIKVEFPYKFDPTTVEITQGESLTFKNDDDPGWPDNKHDVTSSDGRFKSATGPPGPAVPVQGVESLPPGSYNFVCSQHSLGMKGTLKVKAAATTPVAADTTAPSLGLQIVKSSVERILDKGRVVVQTNVSEPVEVSLKLAAKVGKREIALGKRTVDVPQARKRALAVKLSDSGRDRLKRAMESAKSARIQISGKAKDRAGNADRARAGMKFLP